MKKNHGFTLIEMLISMVVLSMVILIGANAYAMFSDRWNGRLGYFNQTIEQARQLILVQEVLQSIIPYVVTDERNQAKLYFEGTRNGFVAVSTKSIFMPNKPAVIKMSFEQQDDLTYHLTYQESIMQKQLLTKVKQPLNFDHKITLFTKLKEIDFYYFGWSSTESKYWSPESILEAPKPKTWLNEYNSLDINLQPEQIQIIFTSAQGDFNLQARLPDMPKNLLAYFGNNDDE